MHTEYLNTTRFTNASFNAYSHYNIASLLVIGVRVRAVPVVESLDASRHAGQVLQAPVVGAVLVAALHLSHLDVPVAHSCPGAGQRKVQRGSVAVLIADIHVDFE